MWYAGKVVDWMSYQSQAKRVKAGRPLHLRQGPIHVYDVNSLYPSVMMGNLYPRQLIAYLDRGSIADLATWRQHLCLIARVRLSTPHVAYPVLHEGERYWCTGEYWTDLAGPELLSALDDGHVIDVGPIASYLPGRPFDSYVGSIYGQKVAAEVAGDELQRQLCKMLLNGLAGKFAQRMPRWEWSDMPAVPPGWGPLARAVDGTPDTTKYRMIAGYVQQETSRLNGPESVPAITAYVCSYARLKMRALREAIGAFHVLYQDTDSLHLTDAGRDRVNALALVSGTTLGALRHEGSYSCGEYRGLKDYTLDGIHVVAGRSKDAKYFGHSFYTQDAVESLDSIIGRKPDGVVETETVFRRWGSYHPRGVMSPDGSVTPAILTAGSLLITGEPPEQPRNGRRKRKG